jgi:xanthine dehydrogenase accessory factor
VNLPILEALASGRQGQVLCTVLRVKGSAPRHPGSWMLAGAEGLVAGSVGGGRGEAAALAASREGAGGSAARLLEIEMQGMDAEGPEMVCGGTSLVLVEPVASPGPYRAALGLVRSGERAILVKRVPGPEGAAAIEIAVSDESGRFVFGGGAFDGASGFDAGLLRRAAETGRPLLAEREGIFFDPMLPGEKLLVLGGGHVGRALAGIAPGLGFDVTVGDDRREFLEPGRFPPGVSTLCAPFREIVDSFPFDRGTYVVIVTRGHLADLECVRAVLPRGWRYAGLIGSRRKTRLLVERVLADGFDRAKVEALHTPIGLRIGAETPEELAVAIAGELIAVRRGAGPSS